jgi:hypothetical protein
MNFQDIQKSLSLTPATTSNDSPFDKGYTRVAGTVSNLSSFIQVDGNLTNDVGYKRRLMFQYNFSNETDFYVVNFKQLNQFGSSYLLGGCVCIKWRVGETVFRYKLMDYRNDLNWSFFPPYTNQKVGKNCVIEFWQDDYDFARGITQPFYIQTDKITIPSSIDDADTVTEIDIPVLTLADLTQPFPLVYPVDFSNQAYITN